MKIHRILISLEALLDTRFACIENINLEWSRSLLKNGYYKRITNNFSFLDNSIDQTAVKEAWNNRTKEILPLCHSTILLQRLVVQRLEQIQKSKDEPEYIDLEVTLNVYPYKLSSDEKEEFKEIIKSHLQTDTVSVIHASPQQMHPHWIKSNFDQVILVDINEWLSFHVDALKNYRMPKVIFTFPLILLDDVSPIGKNYREILDNLKCIFLDVLTPDIIPLGDIGIFTPELESNS